MKTFKTHLTAAIVLLIVAISFNSCKTEQPQETQFAPIFGVQGMLFESKDTTAKLTHYLQFGYLKPGSKSEMTVNIKTTLIGGIKSFHNPIPSTDFALLVENSSTAAIFDTSVSKINTITLGSGQQITYKITGEYMYEERIYEVDSRSIDTIYYGGRTYVKCSTDFNLGIAKKGEIALNTSLVTKETTCSFEGCYKGEADTISWQLKNDGTLTIKTTHGGVITGAIDMQSIGTPTLTDQSGNKYVVCFFTTGPDDKATCTCTMLLKLYKITDPSAAQFSTGESITRNFELIVGCCC